MRTRRPLRSLAVLLLAGCLPLAAAATSAEARSGQALGQGHLWLKVQQTDFGGDTDEVWGVDSDVCVSLEGYWSGWDKVYLGVEIGRIDVGTAQDEDGNHIEEFSFTSGEFNVKRVFDLGRGLTLGLGAGSGAFWASGEEVDTLGRSPLADFGFGYQGFAEFNGRIRRFVAGVQVKYQAAFDFLEIDYSNLRFGGHLGLTF